MGVRGDLTHQAQSLAAGGLLVGVRYWLWLAVGGGSSFRQRGWAPGSWCPDTSGLLQRPRLLSTSLGLGRDRKPAAHGLLVGTQRNKHRGHREGTGALPCRRGCGQQAQSGDRGRWRAISLALAVAMLPWEKCRSFMCMSAGYEMRTFQRLKETHPDLWKPLSASFKPQQFPTDDA